MSGVISRSWVAYNDALILRFSAFYISAYDVSFEKLGAAAEDLGECGTIVTQIGRQLYHSGDRN